MAVTLALQRWGTDGCHLQLSMLRASLGSTRAISGQRLNQHWSGVVGSFFRGPTPYSLLCGRVRTFCLPLPNTLLPTDVCISLDGTGAGTAVSIYRPQNRLSMKLRTAKSFSPAIAQTANHTGSASLRPVM